MPSGAFSSATPAGAKEQTVLASDHRTSSITTLATDPGNGLFDQIYPVGSGQFTIDYVGQFWLYYEQFGSGTMVDQSGSTRIGLTVDYEYEPAAAPEPATWSMMVAGFGAAGFAMRRKFKIAFA